jgi:hypothetical protein
MFWVIQSNLFKEESFSGLLDALVKSNTGYALVNTFESDMTPSINPEGPVYVTGSTSIKQVARNKGWLYFDDNLNLELLLQKYGSYMLNTDAICGQLKDIEHVWDEFHIRPVMDDKAFAGEVTNWPEFVEWRERISKMDCDNSITTLRVTDRVVMSSVKNIKYEYRIFVVDGKVVTGSLYRDNGELRYLNIDDQGQLEHVFIKCFVEDMVKIWCPNKAFAMDIADTGEEGFKIIEINSLNSSGFYKCDPLKYVAAINALKC